MTKRVVMVCDALPLAGKTGHQSYLRDLADYAIDRKLDLVILVLSNRMEFILATHRSLNFPAAVQLIGPNFGRIGRFIFYVSPSAWIRPPYLMLRQYLHRLFRLASRRKGATPRKTAMIGRFVSGRDLTFVRRALMQLNPDAVLIDTIFRAPAVIGAGSASKTILVSHDVFYQKCESLLQVFGRVVPHVTKEMETEIVRQFDHILAVTPEDQRAFQDMAPDSNTIVCSAPARYRGTARQAGPPRAIFVGSGANHNVDGVNWFLADIWPRIREQVPAAEINLVGAICRHVTACPGVNTLGIVDDLAPVLSMATCAVNPLRAGSGLKIKMLDYLSFGVPVVTTTVGAQGFPRDGDEPFVVCDTAPDFAAMTIKCLEDSTYSERLAARCEAYARHFSQAETFAKLDEILGFSSFPHKT